MIRNNGIPRDWESQVTSTDVLAFVLSLQFAAVDRQLKQDMRIVSERRDCACGEVEHLFFYEFDPSPEAKEAFNAYVACKWPLHVYSVDPAVEQQNVLDAFSRRSELQLALAVAVASGSMNANNATRFARRLEFDLESVGLNRTAVGFGAGETTFGWRFYPRVQSPPTESNPLRIANLLAWNGPGPNWDVKNRQIEPGPRECIALMVVPNFIPALASPRSPTGSTSPATRRGSSSRISRCWSSATASRWPAARWPASATRSSTARRTWSI